MTIFISIIIDYLVFNIYKNKGFIMSEIKAWISFYLELPFQLGLPTGHYALNKPSQLKIHRDIYYIQKGNEIENPSTLENRIIPQERLFDEKGLCVEEFISQYKRKLKTTIFRKYTISYSLSTSSEEEFYNKIKNKEVNYKNLGIPPEMVLNFQKTFMDDVNIFLKYYANYFPENTPENSLQYEIRPLSIFEFSACLLEPTFIVKIDDLDYGVLLRKIIMDFHDQTGIPSLTYTNIKKIEEFEKIIQSRNKFKIFPYQDLFNMSKTFYRTHRETMTSAIIVNALMALESILNILEDKLPIFQIYKNERKKKGKAILNFYSNFRNAYTIKFLEEELGYTPKEAQDHVIFFNDGRKIRNQIVHELELKYDMKTDEIEYTHNKKNFTIELSKLWKHLIRLYSSFNIFILKLIYPEINWELKSTYESTIIGAATDDSKNSIVPIFPDRDWRETYSYHYDLPNFSVPPERMARAVETSDGTIYPLNYDPGRLEHEFYNQVILPNKMAQVKMDVNILKLSDEELNEKITNRDLLIDFITDERKVIAKYIICKSCGNFCSVYHISRYKKENCPKCKSKIFELSPNP